VISGVLIGDKELIARMGQIPARMKAAVDLTVQKLGFELEARVKRKLTGEVLRVQTGRLRASISRGAPGSMSRFESTADASIYYVGTNVSYGVMWERGIAAHTVRPVNAKALRFTIGGEVLFRMSARIPAQAPRKFLEPALFEMRPTIITQLSAALQRGAREALKV